MHIRAWFHGAVLIAGLACHAQPASAAPGQSTPTSPAQPAPAPDAAGVGAAAPSPDFDGNWYVLEPGQTLQQFADSIGVPAEAVQTRARQVGRKWLAQLERHIETRFPAIKDAWGGRVILPRAGYADTVKEGEDLWKLVERLKTSAVELLVVNGLGPDDAAKIQPGMRVVVPGIVRTKEGKMVRLLHPRQAAAQAKARELNLGTVGTAGKLLFGHMEDRWVESAGGPNFGSTISWPVAGGWFVRGYGSGDEGYHLAVDVAAPIGWPVRAVQPGIVAYVGDGIRGYGNIIMIIHPGGFVSFHAHLSASFVYSGESVDRGEVIGEVGSTGISKGPHVHFELVHNGLNCDPEPLFRPGMKRHDGSYIEDMPKLEWTAASTPKDLKCALRPRHHPHSRWVVHEDAARDADQRSGLK